MIKTEGLTGLLHRLERLEALGLPVFVNVAGACVEDYVAVTEALADVDDSLRTIATWGAQVRSAGDAAADARTASTPQGG